MIGVEANLIERIAARDQLGERGGIDQATLSHALGRLRRHYKDPLFFRSGNRLVATSLMEMLLPEAERLLKGMERLDAMSETFDPGTSNRVFRLHMLDVSELIILPRLLQVCATRAPYVSIKAVRLSGPSISEELESGGLDLAIGTPWHAEQSLCQQALFKQNLVGICSASHPLIDVIESPEGFMRCRHCVTEARGPIAVAFSRAMERYAGPRHVVLQVPGLLSIPALVSNTDLVAAVPVGLLAHADRRRLHVFKLPIPRCSFTVMQHWHKRRQHDKANLWLRKTIKDCLGGLDVEACKDPAGDGEAAAVAAAPRRSARKRKAAR